MEIKENLRGWEVSQIGHEFFKIMASREKGQKSSYKLVLQYAQRFHFKHENL